MRRIPPFPTPEERLLVLMTLVPRSDSETDQARILGGQITSWGRFWELSELNATSPLVYSNLVSSGMIGAVGTETRRRFEERSAEIRQANEARLGVARELFAGFARKNVPVVILKGMLFAETIYRDPSYKKMNDVDILVRRGDLDAVYDLYREMRLFSAAELVGGSPRKQEKFSHHAPPFFSRDLACMIGTHWGLITPLAPYRLDYDAIWSRVQPVTFHGQPALSMAPEDNLHHLCVHLPYYKTGLRELADIYNLIRHHRVGLNWELLLSEVRKAGTENLVHHALMLVNRIDPSPEVAEAVASLEPSTSWYFRRDARRKSRSLGLLLRSRSVHPSRIEKAYADLNSTRKASEKWRAYVRMWGHLLLPPAADAARMSAVERPTLRSRLVAPWRLFRVFARDVGAGIFILILMKCAWDVLKATLRAPFESLRDVPDYRAYAEKLGVTVADLNRLKEALE